MSSTSVHISQSCALILGVGVTGRVTMQTRNAVEHSIKGSHTVKVCPTWTTITPLKSESEGQKWRVATKAFVKSSCEATGRLKSHPKSGTQTYLSFVDSNLCLRPGATVRETRPPPQTGWFEETHHVNDRLQCQPRQGVIRFAGRNWPDIEVKQGQIQSLVADLPKFRGQLLFGVK